MLQLVEQWKDKLQYTAKQCLFKIFFYFITNERAGIKESFRPRLNKPLIANDTAQSFSRFMIHRPAYIYVS